MLVAEHVLRKVYFIEHRKGRIVFTSFQLFYCITRESPRRKQFYPPSPPTLSDAVPWVQPSTASRLKIQKIKKSGRGKEKERGSWKLGRAAVYNCWVHVESVKQVDSIRWLESEMRTRRLYNTVFRCQKWLKVTPVTLLLSELLLPICHLPNPPMRGFQLGGWRDPRGANLPVTNCHPTSFFLSPFYSNAHRADIAVGVVVVVAGWILDWAVVIIRYFLFHLNKLCFINKNAS